MVWKETVRQGMEMLEYWKTNGSCGISSTNRDVRILSIHVLTFIGFGVSCPFQSVLSRCGLNSSISHRDAFSIIIDRIFLVCAFPRWLLRLPFVPKSWKLVGYAIHEVERYIDTTLKKEKHSGTKRTSNESNLLSNLVNGSLDAQKVPQLSGEKRYEGYSGRSIQGLTDKEIFSNMFAITLAGHETTGSTLAHCIFYLAAHPEWQRWIAEEIHQVLGDFPDADKWEYETIFPRLNRCLAVMVRKEAILDPCVFINHR